MRAKRCNLSQRLAIAIPIAIPLTDRPRGVSPAEEWSEFHLFISFKMSVLNATLSEFRPCWMPAASGQSRDAVRWPLATAPQLPTHDTQTQRHHRVGAGFRHGPDGAGEVALSRTSGHRISGAGLRQIHELTEVVAYSIQTVHVDRDQRAVEVVIACGNGAGARYEAAMQVVESLAWRQREGNSQWAARRPGKAVGRTVGAGFGESAAATKPCRQREIRVAGKVSVNRRAPGICAPTLPR